MSNKQQPTRKQPTRRREQPARTREQPARTREQPARPPQVLVLGYDRTDSARHAARWAVGELGSEDKLVIVHSSRPLHAPPSALSTPEERSRLARALIDELLLEGEDALFDVDVVAEVSDADPVSALVAAAERHHARAIVIGSERHSRLHKAIGTVTTELLKRSPVPVIAVPMTDTLSGSEAA